MGNREGCPNTGQPQGLPRQIKNMAKKSGIGQYLELGFLTSELILKNLSFVIFLGFLAVIYIANSRFAESNIRQIQHLQRDLRELRWQYMTLESENMFNSRQSELAERLKDQNFEAFGTQPKRIVVIDKTDY
jgi:hypothetical protein